MMPMEQDQFDILPVDQQTKILYSMVKVCDNLLKHAFKWAARSRNPIKIIFSVNLRYSHFKRSYWMFIFLNQSECLKTSVA